MKKYPYSAARIFEIFSQLHKRGLAMFLGYQNGQPMIWMDSSTPLARAPISIATANVLLNEILIRELEGENEVLDDLCAPRRSRANRRTVAMITEVI